MALARSLAGGSASERRRASAERLDARLPLCKERAKAGATCAASVRRDRPSLGRRLCRCVRQLARQARSRFAVQQGYRAGWDGSSRNATVAFMDGWMDGPLTRALMPPPASNSVARWRPCTGAARRRSALASQPAGSAAAREERRLPQLVRPPPWPSIAQPTPMANSLALRAPPWRPRAKVGRPSSSRSNKPCESGWPRLGQLALEFEFRMFAMFRNLDYRVEGVGGQRWFVTTRASGHERQLVPVAPPKLSAWAFGFALATRIGARNSAILHIASV